MAGMMHPNEQMGGMGRAFPHPMAGLMHPGMFTGGTPLLGQGQGQMFAGGTPMNPTANMGGWNPGNAYQRTIMNGTNGYGQY